MKEAIGKAEVLIEALAYIRTFRDHLVIIKLGGSVMDDTSVMRAILQDVVFMETVGVRPVVVHGGGAAISRAMAAAGLESKFIRGRRFTDEAVIEIVSQVLIEEINDELVQKIEQLGGRAAGIHQNTKCALSAEKLLIEDGSGECFDLGWVGRVNQVDCQLLDNLCLAGVVPVIPSLGLDEKARTLNINADTAAGAIAAAVGASRLLMLTDVKGVLNKKGKLISEMTAAQGRANIRNGTIKGGMIPKTETCIKSVGDGVEAAVILDGRVPHALILEIFTEHGAGTLIRKTSKRYKKRRI